MGVHLFPKWRAQLCLKRSQAPDLCRLQIFALLWSAPTQNCTPHFSQKPPQNLKGQARGCNLCGRRQTRRRGSSGVGRNWGMLCSARGPPCPSLGPELEPPWVSIPSWRASKGEIIVGWTSPRQVRSVPPPFRGRPSRGGGYDEIMGAGRQDPALLEPPQCSRSRMVPKTAFTRVLTPPPQLKAPGYVALTRRSLHWSPALKGDRPANP